MPKTKVTYDVVREIGLAMPGVEEGTMYGSPALKLAGKLLACLPVDKSAEPDSLAVRVDFEQRAALLAEGEGTYYLPKHYESSPVVLVRLAKIQVDQLRDLLNAARQFIAPTKNARTTAGLRARKNTRKPQH